MHLIRRVECIALGLVVLAGCPAPPDKPRYIGAGHTTPQYGGTFTFHHESAVRGLDPHMAFDELSFVAIKLLFDGLLEYDLDANLIPQLAEALPEVTEEGKVFRFRLRNGIFFHDGQPVTAEDIRWSMERMLDPKIGSPGFTFYTQLDGLDAYRQGKAKHIQGIQVLDPHTIEFRLKAPDQTFLNAMAMTFAYPVPRSLYETRPHEAASKPIGTGPFSLQEWEAGVRLVFKRNHKYWDRTKPYVDRIVFLENLTRDAAMMRFRTGEIDHAHRFSPSDYLYLIQSKAWKPYRIQEPEKDIWGVVMNCGIPPFTNVHVRRAVAYALDREGWSRARNHRLRPTGQPIPPGILGYDPLLEVRHVFNLARAKEEMRLAGYPNGIQQEVELWIGHGSTGRFYGELTQQDLAKIGIKIRLKPVAFALYMEESGKPGRVPMMISGWSQDFPDPADFLDILFHSRAIHDHDSENRSFYSNPKLDALLDRARIEQDRDRRRQMYIRAQQIVVKDAPWAFMWNDVHLEAWQPYVKGYRPHPVWSQLVRDVWLDLPKQRVAQRSSAINSRLAWAGWHSGRGEN
jgi:oligopeptide transport system substrate-binding protein